MTTYEYTLFKLITVLGAVALVYFIVNVVRALS